MPIVSPPLGATVCEACGSRRVKLLRHSPLWSFDVGRCADCKMVYVLDPPPFQGEKEYVEGEDWEEYIDAQRGDDSLRIEVLKRLARLAPKPADQQPVLFDVGAGVGDFMALANEYGFAATGNDISSRGIKHALDRHGVTVSPLMLDEQPEQSVDAMTMWCVIAHVNEPREFLRDAYRMLKPGGVLFLRTPRWCAIDTVGVTGARLSGGRARRLADRRVTTGHMHLFNRANMTTLLSSLGFVDIAAEPTCHYPLNTNAYLASTGGLIGSAKRLSGGLDALIERGWFIRNTLMVYAQRPTDR